MPTTRSASRAAAAPAPEPEPAPVKKRASTKRKAPDSGTAEKGPRKRAAKASPEEVVEKAPKKRAAKKSAPESAPAPAAAPADWTIPPPGNADTTEVLPAKLTFSFEDAKKHLISVDARFKDVFRRLRCRPYEEVEPVEPFATLATSILGQQISWLAARSVRHKFIRLYFPELPEKADEMTDEDGDKFPTPYQVAQTPISILRTAGLSGRKAEYIQDLASRFDDGRLSSRKVFEVEDEELYEMLIAVRGIGRWTVDMFAMFALRRPDIMPSGDLGVQRGVLRWFLAMHSPEHPVAYSPKKLPNNGAEDETQETKAEGDDLPTFGDASENEALATPPRKLATLPDGESQATEAEAPTPAPAKRPRRVAPTPSAIGLPSLPPALTPSFNTTLVRTGEENGVLPTPLPVGLTVAEMKARLSGKKKVKGQLATPAEMEALTESWKPYRSLGAYFMWALAEDTKGK